MKRSGDRPASAGRIVRPPDLFGAGGYAGTRLDDIAAAAGVTKPIVYRHFASKKGLYLALLARNDREDLPGFFEGSAISPADDSPEALLRAILDELARLRPREPPPVGDALPRPHRRRRDPGLSRRRSAYAPGR